MPTVPAALAANAPPGVAPEDLLWDETLEGGEYAAHRLPRGAVLRLCDLEGDACAHLVVHHAELLSERLNVADTTKVQWQMYVTAGSALLSDRGRALMTIVDDTSGRHDTICGAPTRADHDAKYGDGRVEGPFPNARDRLVVALAKFGLARRDLPPSLGLFKSVRVGRDGSLHLDACPGVAGAHVDVRAELDVIVSVANVPHILDAREQYTCTPLRLVAWRTDRGAGSAVPVTPEMQRALLNTDDWLLGR
jgi:urea carboxylase-associated protein 2